MNPYNLTKGPKRGMPLKIIVTALAMVMASAIVPTPAAAALPAPNWLPGQPMLAGTQVIAMWLPVPGAVKYIVYLNGERIMESPANQYIGAAPDGTGEFKFEVTAVDGTGAESPRSKAGVIKILKLEPPREPIYRVVGEDVVLRWDRPTGAVIFNIYRGEAAEGPFTLLASVQEETYKDSGLEKGKTFYYAVSAKDITGKESDKGPAAVVEIKEASAGVVVKKYDLVIIPSQQIRRIGNMGDWYLDKITFAGRGPDGLIYLLTDSAVVRAIDDNFVVQRTVFVSKPEGMSSNLRLYDMDFVDQDLAVFTDPANGVVHMVDLNSGRVKWTTRIRKPTREEDEDTWKALPEDYRIARAIPAAVAALDDGNVWVSDERGAIIHILDEDGEYVDWIANYSVDSARGIEEKRLAIVNFMRGTSDGKVLIASPLGRRVLKLDPETYTAQYQVGNAANMIGNFIGIRGFYYNEGEPLLVADPTMHTVQGFDLATGEYLFSLGGPVKEADPSQSTRPMIDFNGPMYPILLEGGNIALWLGFDKEFTLRRLMEKLPTAPAAPEG